MEKLAGKPEVTFQEQLIIGPTLDTESLTPQERHQKNIVGIFLLKGRGLTDREVGVELGIAEHTVGNCTYEELTRRGLESVVAGIRAMENEGLITQTQLVDGFVYEEEVFKQLTSREREILGLISREDMWCAGTTEVAYQKHLAEHTVKNYLGSIYSKLGVKNKVQAIIYFLHKPTDLDAEETVSRLVQGELRE
jgi:DNA-binding CsgD family transcriptional regulator